MYKFNKNTQQYHLDQLNLINNLSDLSLLLGQNTDTVRRISTMEDGQKYYMFRIKKRRGGERIIHAPIYELKVIQQRLNFIFGNIYFPPVSAHGYVRNRGIVTNAKIHAGKSYVLNIDLTDFFTSISSDMLRDCLISEPYHIKTESVQMLIPLTCYAQALPQGAPTSPTLSNMYCYNLDFQLQDYSKKNNCDYTRYADDITFSTNRFEDISKLIDTSESTIILNYTLNSIFQQHNLRVNESKLKLRGSKQRQVVTGLITNVFPNVPRKYIRTIRAMLHAWENYGYDAAEFEYHQKYIKKNIPTYKPPPRFSDVVRGKIQFVGAVKGKDDSIFIKLTTKFDKLMQIDAPKNVPKSKEYSTDELYCEPELDNTEIPF